MKIPEAWLNGLQLGKWGAPSAERRAPSNPETRKPGNPDNHHLSLWHIWVGQAGVPAEPSSPLGNSVSPPGWTGSHSRGDQSALALGEVRISARMPAAENCSSRVAVSNKSPCSKATVRSLASSVEAASEASSEP